jgi:hypothetical protein
MHSYSLSIPHKHNMYLHNLNPQSRHPLSFQTKDKVQERRSEARRGEKAGRYSGTSDPGS